MCKGRLIEFSIYSLSICGQRRRWRYQLFKKNSAVLGHVRSLAATRVRAHTHSHIPSRSLALCGAVLILVTAEGLATRDSTGSNQRKPDFFF